MCVAKATWNSLRDGDLFIEPDLSGADLPEAHLVRANLSRAELSEANLSRSVAENPGSKCGSRAWDQETELQICGKSRSGSQAGRSYAWRQSSWGGYDLA